MFSWSWARELFKKIEEKNISAGRKIAVKTLNLSNSIFPQTFVSLDNGILTQTVGESPLKNLNNYIIRGTFTKKGIFHEYTWESVVLIPFYYTICLLCTCMKLMLLNCSWKKQEQQMQNLKKFWYIPQTLRIPRSWVIYTSQTCKISAALLLQDL